MINDYESDKETANFEIAVDKNNFEKILENSKRDGKRQNAEKLMGDWIAAFAENIIKYEKIIRKFMGTLHVFIQVESVPTQHTSGLGNISNCWIRNVIDAADEDSVVSTFNLILHTEDQIKMIEKIPSHRRILHADATGGLVKIPKKECDYGQILTYSMLLKDSMRLDDQEYLLINEMSTSRNDTYQIGSIPKLCPKTESILNNVKFTVDDNSDESENDEENNEIFKNNSIKEMSPFTRHFKKVKSDILKNIRVSNKNENNLYNASFMEFLMENFLPYAFLWSGFVYKNLETQGPISRLTNGTIVKYFATPKKYLAGSKPPSSYVNQTFKIAKGQALRFKTYKDEKNDHTDSENELELEINND
ncbi:unnamed protein product [Brachionus calyciflorus]|uniref:Uncharacterized protein n=1 Tax=Brachionus calyciflorus TaxID=104777 RepID=A0A814CPU0_9BILA|nr:unnamed protein product [Brachionus calyciflorus]